MVLSGEVLETVECSDLDEHGDGLEDDGTAIQMCGDVHPVCASYHFIFDTHVLLYMYISHACMCTVVHAYIVHVFCVQFSC